MNVFIRTKNLQNDISHFVLLADDHYLPALFGKHYENIIRVLYRRKNNLYSYRNTVYSSIEEKITGMCWFYDASKNKCLSILTWVNIFLFNPIIALKILFIKRNELTKQLCKNSFYILIISTDPEYQNMGIGKTLLQKIEKEAILKGKEFIELDVEQNNSNAIAFYKKNLFIEKFRHVFRQGNKESAYIRMIKGI